MTAETFYVLRYTSNVPLKDRHHAATGGRYPNWSAAEDARTALPNRHDLEVLERSSS